MVWLSVQPDVRCHTRRMNSLSAFSNFMNSFSLPTSGALDYKFVQPGVLDAAPVAKPKSHPKPKGHGRVQRSIASYFQPANP